MTHIACKTAGTKWSPASRTSTRAVLLGEGDVEVTTSAPRGVYNDLPRARKIKHSPGFESQPPGKPWIPWAMGRAPRPNLTRHGAKGGATRSLERRWSIKSGRICDARRLAAFCRPGHLGGNPEFSPGPSRVHRRRAASTSFVNNSDWASPTRARRRNISSRYASSIAPPPERSHLPTSTRKIPTARRAYRAGLCRGNIAPNFNSDRGHRPESVIRRHGHKRSGTIHDQPSRRLLRTHPRATRPLWEKVYCRTQRHARRSRFGGFIKKGVRKKSRGLAREAGPKIPHLAKAAGLMDGPFNFGQVRTEVYEVVTRGLSP